MIRLNQSGFYVILDLHWNAPGVAQATGQQPMADPAGRTAETTALHEQAG